MEENAGKEGQEEEGRQAKVMEMCAAGRKRKGNTGNERETLDQMDGMAKAKVLREVPCMSATFGPCHGCTGQGGALWVLGCWLGAFEALGTGKGGSGMVEPRGRPGVPQGFAFPHRPHFNVGKPSPGACSHGAVCTSALLWDPRNSRLVLQPHPLRSSVKRPAHSSTAARSRPVAGAWHVCRQAFLITTGIGARCVGKTACGRGANLEASTAGAADEIVYLTST